MKITLEDIFNIPTAVIYYPDKYKSAGSVSIDTRSIKNNSLFVALKGENFDGHDYVNEAVKKGANAVVVSSRKLNRFEKVKIPIISVRNTLDAYSALAGMWRKKFKGKVISITGSNGKTTTKEILAELLKSKYKVHKTHSNNNNQIGVPLTILSASPRTDFLVIEHGTNHLGEIKYTAEIAAPDMALITNIGNSHNEYLGTKETILKEKLELFNNCAPDGTAFINNDDPLLCGIKKHYKNKITFGFKGKCSVKGKKIKSKKPDRENVSIQGFGKNIEISIPLLGDANVKNFLAAASIGLKCGLTKKEIIEKSRQLKSVNGRLTLNNFKNFTLIDDTYNSNPDSVISALNVIKKFKGKNNRIVVLGDMFELGKKAEHFHRETAAVINKGGIGSVYTIGKKSKLLNMDLNTKITKKHFTNRDRMKKFLNQLDLDNKVLLVKGSRGMRMEEFVNVIKMRGE